jgi:hypothetical protein
MVFLAGLWCREKVLSEEWKVEAVCFAIGTPGSGWQHVLCEPRTGGQAADSGQENAASQGRAKFVAKLTPLGKGNTQVRISRYELHISSLAGPPSLMNLNPDTCGEKERG